MPEKDFYLLIALVYRRWFVVHPDRHGQDWQAPKEPPSGTRNRRVLAQKGGGTR
jgi:hypothetical protein